MRLARVLLEGLLVTFLAGLAVYLLRDHLFIGLCMGVVICLIGIGVISLLEQGDGPPVAFTGPNNQPLTARQLKRRKRKLNKPVLTALKRLVSDREKDRRRGIPPAVLTIPVPVAANVSHEVLAGGVLLRCLTNSSQVNCRIENVQGGEKYQARMDQLPARSAEVTEKVTIFPRDFQADPLPGKYQVQWAAAGVRVYQDGRAPEDILDPLAKDEFNLPAGPYPAYEVASEWRDGRATLKFSGFGVEAKTLRVTVSEQINGLWDDRWKHTIEAAENGEVEVAFPDQFGVPDAAVIGGPYRVEWAIQNASSDFEKVDESGFSVPR